MRGFLLPAEALLSPCQPHPWAEAPRSDPGTSTSSAVLMHFVVEAQSSPRWLFSGRCAHCLEEAGIRAGIGAGVLPWDGGCWPCCPAASGHGAHPTACRMENGFYRIFGLAMDRDAVGSHCCLGVGQAPQSHRESSLFKSGLASGTLMQRSRDK